MPVVLITWPTPVRYSTNNGFSMTEYDPGQLYEVPPHVAQGMLVRNWARLANAGDISDAAAKQQQESEGELPTLPVKGSETEVEEIKRTKRRQSYGER